MSATDILTDIERRAWRSTFDDGLFEFLLGGMLVLVGLATRVPNDRLLYPFHFGLVALFMILKWRVVMPRAGMARFAPPRRQRKMLSATVLLASTILGAVVTVLFALDGGAAAWLRAHPIVFDAGFPILMVTVFSGLALLLDVARIHALGVVFALAFGTQLWFHQGLGFLIGGGLVCLFGVVLFARFLRSHRLPSAANRDAEPKHVR